MRRRALVRGGSRIRCMLDARFEGKDRITAAKVWQVVGRYCQTFGCQGSIDLRTSNDIDDHFLHARTLHGTARAARAYAGSGRVLAQARFARGNRWLGKLLVFSSD